MRLVSLVTQTLTGQIAQTPVEVSVDILSTWDQVLFLGLQRSRRLLLPHHVKLSMSLHLKLLRKLYGSTPFSLPLAYLLRNQLPFYVTIMHQSTYQKTPYFTHV